MTHIAVVRSGFGGVLGELAEMLVDRLRSDGRDATIVDSSDPSVARAELVILLGAGVEFDATLDAVGEHGGAEVVLWALDPMPEPHVDDAARAAGFRAAKRLRQLRRFERGAVAAVGPRGQYGQRKRVARAAAMRVVLGRSPVRVDDAFAFERLAWIRRAVEAGRVHRVHPSSPASVRTLAEHGVASSWCPVGFDPSMGTDHGAERDLDVVFLGRTIDDRGPSVARLERELAANGIALTIADGGCFGRDREVLLNRAKVSLNLHKFPWHLERIRLLLSMACGAAVVSELPVPDATPFVVGTHLEASAFAGLAPLVTALVRDDERRRAVVAEATALLPAGPTMGDVARVLVGA